MTKYLYRGRLNSFVFSIFQVFSGIERGQIEWDGWNKGTKGNVLIYRASGCVICVKLRIQQSDVLIANIFTAF